MNLALTILNQFFNYCVDMGYCDANPTGKVKKISAEQLSPKSLDESTVNKMRNALENHCLKKEKFEHLMMFDFMLKCGLRVSEVVKLRFKNVQFETDEDGKEGAYIHVEDGKGGKHRDVYMPDDLVMDYKKFKSNLTRSKNESDFIFKHHGSKYSETAIRIHYHRLCKDRGIKHISPHMLRHTFAIRRMASGVPHTYIQNDMGHSNFATTARYAMPSRDNKRKFANY